MKEIEESQDNSKIIPGVSAGIVLLVNQVSGYYKDSNDPFWEGVSSLILAFGVYVFYCLSPKEGVSIVPKQLNTEACWNK